ncbi:hypothetical protein ABG768_005105 [Culter alburnus]|uniref:Uncharacterized protein n=1 Tax=Culter alburnus TaxID=194366 RepID=A0AAW1ZST2_CULAL
MQTVNFLVLCSPPPLTTECALLHLTTSRLPPPQWNLLYAHFGDWCPALPRKQEPWKVVRLPGFQTSNIMVESALCPLQSFSSGLATQHESWKVYSGFQTPT